MGLKYYLVTGSYYLLLLIGLILMIFPIVIPYHKRKKTLKQLKKSRNNKNKNKISLILETAYGDYGKEKLIISEAVSTLIVIFFGCKLGFNIVGFIFILLLIMLIPIVLIYIKLYINHVQISKEGEKLILELLSQYIICKKNIIESLEKCSINLEHNKNLQKILYNLAYRIKDYSSDNELYDAITEFSFKVGTKWSQMLANSIYIAVKHGEDITASIQDILNDIRQIKKVIEKDKQLNNETFIIIKYVLPVSYFLSIFTMIKYMNFSIGKYLNYQFNSSMGFKFIVGICFLAIVNYLVYKIISKPKYDI